MKGIITYLRVLVYLKRIAAELHRSNELAEQRLKFDYPAYKKLDLKPKPRVLADMYEPTVEEWDKTYEENVAAGIESRIEES